MIEQHPILADKDRVNHKSTSNSILPTLIIASSLAFNTSAATIFPDLTLQNRKSKLEVSDSKQQYFYYSAIENSWIVNVMSKLKRNATVNGFPLPNERTLELTSDLIKSLRQKKLTPQFVNPSPEGGAIVEYFNEGKYLIVEIINNGEIALVRKSDNNTEAFDLEEANLTRYALESV